MQLLSGAQDDIMVRDAIALFCLVFMMVFALAGGAINEKVNMLLSLDA